MPGDHLAPSQITGGKNNNISLSGGDKKWKLLRCWTADCDETQAGYWKKLLLKINWRKIKIVNYFNWHLAIIKIIIIN